MTYRGLGGVFMTLDGDTIVAISTPPGRGGIGIVRLSGPEARAIAEPLLRLRAPMAAGRARVGEILDRPSGLVLDEAVVTFYAAPRSYTTEDVVEIACHGSPVLLEAVVRAAVAGGARLAEPGEFTHRAFLAGRLDLTQAEAVQDLIASSTLHQARVAAAQLGGSLARSLGPSKRELVELIAGLEAGVDFAEDDIELMAETEIARRIAAILAPLQALGTSYAYGSVLREGFTLAIVGRPNAGKSSLFNRLLGRERAIVTPTPGTTRDPIAETLALEGIPVRLVDTAGLRDAPEGAEGEAEREGIARTHATMAEADLVLRVVDATALDMEDLRRDLGGQSEMLLLTKGDLLAARSAVPEGALMTSAVTGEGIEALRRAIVAHVTRNAPVGDSAILTNLRQQRAIEAAVQALGRAILAIEAQVPHEMLLLDLYQALGALDEMTGVTGAEEILTLIFSKFCIGK